MNLEEMFTVTFSIMYGIMLNALFGWNLFHFGSICANREENAGRRMLFSFIFINLLPIFYFAKAFQWLSSINTINFWSIIGVFFMSFVVFGFYRLIPILILLGHKYPFLQIYDPLLYTKNKLTKEELYLLREKSLEDMDKQFIRIGVSLFGQIIALFFYMFFLPIISIFMIIMFAK